MYTNDKVVMFRGTIYESGYGLIARKVMRDKNLKAQAKAIYAYLCSFAGTNEDNSRSAFPSVSLMKEELGIKSQDTFYKYMNQLKDAGYITIEKQREANGNFERNIYYIEAVPQTQVEQEVQPCSKKSTTIKSTTIKSTTINRNTNNNSLKNNSLNNNSINNLSISDSMKNFILKHQEKLDGDKLKTIEELDGLIDEESYRSIILSVLENKRIRKFKGYLLASIKNYQKEQESKSKQPKQSVRSEILPEWLEKDEKPDESQNVNDPDFEKKRALFYERLENNQSNNQSNEVSS